MDTPTASPPSEGLPQELIDIVFDHLHPDLLTLANCALVCRAWLPYSRRHTFGSVVLTHPISSGFLELLESPSATFPTHIRRIDLALHNNGGLGPSKVFNDLIPHLASLTTVRSLRLGKFDWMQVTPATVASAVSTFAGITELDIHLVHYQSATQLADFLCCFPHLERLHLTPYVSDEAEVALEGRHISPHLRSLFYKPTDGSRAPIIDWLHSRSGLPPIRSLDLPFVSTEEVSTTAQLLRATGRSLQKLSISFQSMVTPEDLNARSLLSQSVELRALTLAITLRPFHINLPTHAPLALLSSINSSIETLTINLTIYFIEHLSQIEWAHMDDALSDPKCATLRDVHLFLHIQSSNEVPAYEPTIRARLPKCDERGILRVTSSPQAPRLISFFRSCR